MCVSYTNAHPPILSSLLTLVINNSTNSLYYYTKFKYVLNKTYVKDSYNFTYKQTT